MCPPPGSHTSQPLPASSCNIIMCFSCWPSLYLSINTLFLFPSWTRRHIVLLLTDHHLFSSLSVSISLHHLYPLVVTLALCSWKPAPVPFVSIPQTVLNSLVKGPSPSLQDMSNPAQLCHRDQSRSTLHSCPHVLLIIPQYLLIH